MLRYLILLGIIFLMTAPRDVAAQELLGSQAKILAYSKLSKEQLVQLRKGCDVSPLTPLPISYEECVARTSKGLFNQLAWNTCFARNLNSGFVVCMLDYEGMEYPENYVGVCAKVTVSGNKGSGPKKCFEYLAKTKSTFNEEAFKLCLKVVDNNLDSAKDCINSIRDRQLSNRMVAELKTCSENILPFRGFARCWNDVTDQAPLRNICSPRVNGSIIEIPSGRVGTQ